MDALTSPYQYGLFFEEINHAGEGGLYAELVKNRSFEDGANGWSAVNGATMNLSTTNLLNDAQANALVVSAKNASAASPKGIANAGYWGMAFRKDSTYTLTFWARGQRTLGGHLLARLVSEDGTVIGQADITGEMSSTQWNKLTATIRATENTDKGSLQLLTNASGTMYVDVVSLFPATYKGRANGLRPDLAQACWPTPIPVSCGSPAVAM